MNSSIRSQQLWSGYCRVFPHPLLELTFDRFVNMMYDFQFSAPGKYDQVCQLADPINNPDPIVGCRFFQAGVSFAAISWYPRTDPRINGD